MRLSCSRLFRDDTSRKRIVGALLIHLLLVGSFSSTHRQRVFLLFCWDGGFLRFVSECGLESEMKTRQFNQQWINKKESSVIKTASWDKAPRVRENKTYLNKNIFLMQTLNDLLTEALTYNWACIIQTTFNMGEMENKISISICVLKHSSVHEWLKTCSMKTQSGERKKAKKIKLHLDICCPSAPSWEENWTENGIQTNRTMGISTDNRQSAGRFRFSGFFPRLKLVAGRF